MPTFVPKPGWLVAVPESDEDRQGRILLPDARRRKRTTVRCLLHNPTRWWDCIEPRLDGLRLVVEKWAWKDIDLGRVHAYLIPEYGVLAVIEEDSMTGKQLLQEIYDNLEMQLKDEVGDLDKELNETQLEQIRQNVAADIDDVIESVQTSEAEDDEEASEDEPA